MTLLVGAPFKAGIKDLNSSASGAEPWLAHLTSIHYTPQSKPIVESDKLTAECRRRGLESERLFGKKEILLPPRKG